jgi:hypothetical protein
MNWPSHTDYQDAIQNPHICFEEAALKEGDVTCDMLGLPRVMSGNFACVYSVTTKDKKRWAIRCFVRQVLGQQGRYARLSQHLFGLGLDCMVGFEYFLRGIKVRNEWYPVLKMEWVHGLPLNNYVDEHFQESELMRGLVPKWRVIMSQLRSHQLAHGDLQHGNVMVTDDAEIKLIDYDGMYTPAFRGKAPELGHANFQHPRRTPDYYNENLDDFSALITHMSLLAIADEPALFDKFYSGDNLLMVSSDYRNPTNSEAFKRLEAHKNEQVKQLAKLLKNCCLVDVSKVPQYEQTIALLEKGSLEELMPAAAAQTAEVTSTAAPSWLTPGAAAAPAAATPAPGAASKPASSAPQPAAPKPAAPRPAPAYAAGSAAPRPSAPAPRPAPRPASPARPAGTPTQTPTPLPTSEPSGVYFGLTTTQWLMVGGLTVVAFIVVFLLMRAL